MTNKIYIVRFQPFLMSRHIIGYYTHFDDACLDGDKYKAEYIKMLPPQLQHQATECCNFEVEEVKEGYYRGQGTVYRPYYTTERKANDKAYDVG